MALQEDFRSIRRLRYPLPEVVNPTTSVCIEVHVPNDIGYISAFWGQMFALSRWYAWLGDTSHTAKDVAAVWRGVYEAAQESECQNVLVRTSPVNDCLLQVSYDGGELWETVYNAYGCALKAANDEFGSSSSNGASRAQPGEQPGGATPDPEQCFDLDLTVQGNSMLLIPLAIKSGWTLKLTEVKGAWNDGNIVHDWVCPTGHSFFFGTCSLLVEGTNAGDPIPTSPHMLLILRLPDGTYSEIPLDGTEYVVPEGQPEGNTFLLANDAPLSDNQGSVSLHLLACNTSLHCYEYDFTTGEHGFVVGGFTAFGPDADGRLMGVYGTGQWDTTDYYSGAFNYSDRAVSISRSFSALTARRIEVDYGYQAGTGNWGARIFVVANETLLEVHTNGDTQTMVWTGVRTIDKIGVQSWPSGHGGNFFDGSGNIKRIRIYSTDPAPEGSTVCA